MLIVSFRWSESSRLFDGCSTKPPVFCYRAARRSLTDPPQCSDCLARHCPVATEGGTVNRHRRSHSDSIWPPPDTVWSDGSASLRGSSCWSRKRNKDWREERSGKRCDVWWALWKYEFSSKRMFYRRREQDNGQLGKMKDAVKLYDQSSAGSGILDLMRRVTW